MQKVRGSNPLSSTDFLVLCSMVKTLIKTLTGLGFFVALAWVVFIVVEDAVHHGRSAADLGHDHVAVDGFGDVGGLWPSVSLMSWIGTPLLLMIDTAVCRPSWACQPMPAFLVIWET